MAGVRLTLTEVSAMLNSPPNSLHCGSLRAPGSPIWGIAPARNPPLRSYDRARRAERGPEDSSCPTRVLGSGRASSEIRNARCS